MLLVDEIAGLVSMPVLSADAEVTVEVNPDDVTPDFVDETGGCEPCEYGGAEFLRRGA